MTTRQLCAGLTAVNLVYGLATFAPINLVVAIVAVIVMWVDRS